MHQITCLLAVGIKVPVRLGNQNDCFVMGKGVAWVEMCHEYSGFSTSDVRLNAVFLLNEGNIVHEVRVCSVGKIGVCYRYGRF